LQRKSNPVSTYSSVYTVAAAQFGSPLANECASGDLPPRRYAIHLASVEWRALKARRQNDEGGDMVTGPGHVALVFGNRDGEQNKLERDDA
jgi:hypothetical protein